MKNQLESELVETAAKIAAWGESHGMSRAQLVRNFKPVRLTNGLVALWDFVEKKAYLPQLVSAPGTYAQFPVVGSTGDKINAGTVILIR